MKEHGNKSVMSILIILLLTVPAFISGDCTGNLEELVGYTIVASKTIEGWYDDDEREDGTFNGCTFGRVILFSDGTRLTCSEFGYMYAFRPTAIIFAKEISFGGKKHYDIKMMVEDEIYDMR